MEMRLGKSKVIIERLRNAMGRVLVIAPLSTLRTWEGELESEGITDVAVVVGTPRERWDIIHTGKRWNLINYEGLKTCPAALETQWGAVVVDESSRLRNPKTTISKTIIKAFGNTPIKAVLSGLPAPETPMDYFQQFKFLYGKFLGFNNYWSFRNVACFNAYKWKWILKHQFKDKIRKHIQTSSFILSRKDAGMGNKKIYETRTIKIESEQKRLMQRAEKEFILGTEPNEVMTKFVPVVWIWLAQMSGGFLDGELKYSGKIKELVSLLEGELKNEQVVVWFRFNQELELSSKVLLSRGITCSKLWGNVSESERWSSIKAFNGRKNRILLCQQKVGLYGIDLSAASTGIYYSNGFSAETRAQSEDRIEHPSKKEPLLIIDLVTEDSIDSDILKALKKKNKTSQFYLRREIYDGMRRRIQ